MNNLQKIALVIFKEAIIKSKENILMDLNKEYLKDLKSKSWYEIAYNNMTDFTIELEELIYNQRDAYIKVLKENKNIYNKKVENDVIKKKKYKVWEYLDNLYNRVVVKDIKDVLVTLEKSFKESLKRLYRKFAIDKTVVPAMGLEFNFNKFDKKTRDILLNKNINFAKEVSETTTKEIKKILVKGYEKGLNTDEISKMINKSTSFSLSRCEAIARTEIMSACNNADYISYSKNPDIIGKKWISINNSRTRPTHRVAHGQVRKLEEPFIVGFSKLMHPGDSSLGASAKELIKCRCTTVPIFSDEKELLESKESIYNETDVGTKEWLLRQDDKFIESYLGGQEKRILFKADAISISDANKKMNELMEEGIRTISKHTIRHSTEGDFSEFMNPQKPEKGGGKLLKGGHSQKNIDKIETLKQEYKNHPKYDKFKANFDYNIVKTYSNGVRIGNVPKHAFKDKRTGIYQTWFPSDWTDEKIKIAGTYVVNLDKNKGKIGFLFGYFENIKVGVIIEPEGIIGTIFPDKIQDHLEDELQELEPYM